MTTEVPRQADVGPPRADAWTAREFRDVVGTFVTGITVVATGGDEPAGMTTNSFASVSLDPALVLFCARRGSKVDRALAASRCFSVNVLTDRQEVVARHFASPDRGVGVESFASVPWLPGTCGGAPILTEATAALECSLWQTYDGGDHSIVVGKVERIHHLAHSGSVLAYHRGHYQRVHHHAGVPEVRASGY